MTDPGSMPQRDPAARTRASFFLLGLLILWPLLVTAQFQPTLLFDRNNLEVILNFLAGFLPPETSGEFLGYLWVATLETLAIATAGIALALLLAVPLGILTTSALSAAAIGPGPGYRRSQCTHYGLKAILTILRSIPELVWALIFVRVFGLGPAAGVLALALTYGGMLAKVYSEILESINTRPAQTILEAGGSRFQAFLYGLLPSAARELTSYTIYRWECAIRASVVMGFVGAGGLGQLMDQAMKMLNGGEASTILLTFLALVLAADALSNLLRRQVNRAGRRPRTSGIGYPGATIILTGLLLTSASFLYLQLGLGELFSLESLVLIRDFIFSFFPPDLSIPWLQRIADGVLETLAISAVSTLLAAGAGFLLALPASGRYGLISAQLVRFLLNILRSIPELVWATLTVLAVGLGPFAGTLALALHTTGVLGRLFAEALQNAPQPPAITLTDAGARPGIAFFYGTLPNVLPQWLAYTLYRWEMNIRMAAILGFVGAGGLGQLLYFELSLFRHAQASTVIAAMLCLCILVDFASGSLRKRL